MADTPGTIQPVNPLEAQAREALAAAKARRAAAGTAPAPVPQPVPAPAPNPVVSTNPVVDQARAVLAAAKARRAAQAVAPPVAPQASQTPPIDQGFSGVPNVGPVTPGSQREAARGLSRTFGRGNFTTVEPQGLTPAEHWRGIQAPPTIGERVAGYADIVPAIPDIGIPMLGRQAAALIHDVGRRGQNILNQFGGPGQSAATALGGATQSLLDDENRRYAEALALHNPVLGAAPGAGTVANVGASILPFAAPWGKAMPAVMAGSLGGQAYADALQNGATPAEAEKALLISGATGAVLPGLGKLAAPLTEGAGKIAGNALAPIAAPIVNAGLQGAGAGAGMIGADIAGTATYNPKLAEQKFEEELAPGVGTMTGIGALIGALTHRPGVHTPAVHPSAKPPVVPTEAPKMGAESSAAVVDEAMKLKAMLDAGHATGTKLAEALAAREAPKTQTEQNLEDVSTVAKEAAAKQTPADIAAYEAKKAEYASRARERELQNAKDEHDLAVSGGEPTAIEKARANLETVTARNAQPAVPNVEAPKPRPVVQPTQPGAEVRPAQGAPAAAVKPEPTPVQAGEPEATAGPRPGVAVPPNRNVSAPESKGIKTSPVETGAASRFTAEHAQEVAPERTVPPYVSTLGQMYENLPGGQSGRFVDMLPHPHNPTALQYVFEHPDGSRSVFQGRELEAHAKANGGIMEPVSGDIKSVVVKRGTNVPKTVATPSAPKAAEVEAQAPAPARQAPEASGEVGGVVGGGRGRRGVEEGQVPEGTTARIAAEPEHVPTETSVRAGEEQRIREHGLTEGEAKALENRGEEHPIIPESTHEAAQFISGNKKFESLQDWQEWWKEQPRGNKRAAQELMGGEKQTTRVDEAGHVEAINPQKIVRPTSASVRVSNEGEVRHLKMDAKALPPDDNMSHTTGTAGKGNIETLPRYYIGRVTDSAKPGLKDKWVVAEWDANNDRHAIEGRGQRQPFKDVPKLKAIGGDGKDVLNPGDVYDSYADAKLAAQDIVAATKRGRTVEEAQRQGTEPVKAGNGEPKLQDVTNPSREISPSDITSGAVSFRSREEITSENPFSGSASKSEREYDSMLRKTIKVLEKLNKQGLTKEQIEKHPAVTQLGKIVDSLGEAVSGKRKAMDKEAASVANRADTKRLGGIEPPQSRGISPTRGGGTPIFSEIADALVAAAKWVRNMLDTGASKVLEKIADKIRMLQEKILPPGGSRSSRLFNEEYNTMERLLGNTRMPTSAELAAKSAEIQKAGHGKTTLGEKLKAAAGDAYRYARKLTHDRRFLDDNAADAELKNRLYTYENRSKIAERAAVMDIADIKGGIIHSKELSDAFDAKILRDDQLWDINNGQYGPGDTIPHTGGGKQNLTLAGGGRAVIEAEHLIATAKMNAHPELIEAVRKRNQIMHDLRARLIMLGDLSPTLLDRPYFRHQNLRHYSEAGGEAVNLGPEISPGGTKPSVLKRRSGSGEDYSTTYHEAELEALTEMRARIAEREFQMHLESQSIAREVRGAIIDRNSRLLETLIDEGHSRVGDGYTGVAKYLEEGNTPAATYTKNYADLLEKMHDAHVAGTLDASFSHPDLARFNQDMIRRQDALAVRFKRGAMENEYVDPASLDSRWVPDGYTSVSLDRGNKLVERTALEPALAEEIKSQGSADVNVDDIHKILALGMEKPNLILKTNHAKQVAEVMSGSGKASLAMRKITAPLSRWFIHNPISIGNYILGNGSTNASLMLVSHPGAVTEVPGARRMLFKLHRGEPLSAAEKTIMDEANEFGVIGGNLAGQFETTGREYLPKHAAMTGRDATNFIGSTNAGKVKWVSRQYDRSAKTSSAVVDDQFKLALFMHLRKLQGPNPSLLRRAAEHFTGDNVSKSIEREMARSPAERAAIEARQAFGDYNTKTQFGKAVTDISGMGPFYTWFEKEGGVAAKLMTSPFRDKDWMNRPVSASVKSAMAAGRLAAKVSAVPLAIMAFNQLQFKRDPELEAEAKRAGINPGLEVILGRTADGRLRSYHMQQFTGDMLRRFGLADFDREFAAMGGASSTRTFSDVLKDMPKSVGYQLADLVTPVVKTPLSLWVGATPSSQALSMIPIQDRFQYVLKSVLGGRIAQTMNEHPHPSWSFADLLSSTTDPDQRQYYDSKKMATEYNLKANPNGVADSAPSTRSASATALHDLVAALNIDDRPAAKDALDSYYFDLANGDPNKYNPENVRQSLGAAHPDAGVGDKAEYLKSLTPSERATHDAAVTWYENLTDPAKNPTLAGILREEAAKDPARFDREQMVNAKTIGRQYDAAREIYKDAISRGEVSAHQADIIERLYAAEDEYTKGAWEATKIDGFIKRLEKELTYASPGDTTDIKAQIDELKRWARAAAAPVQPTNDLHTDQNKTAP